MSGGFFRGTSADQDTRFSNKQAKLLKSQKFAPELDHPVDMTKVKMDVIRPWIAARATELLGFEDEVLINFVYGLLDGKNVDGKKIQIQLTGFMEKNTGKFMKELWSLLLSAQKNISGVPQQFLDAKEEEQRKKKEENDRIAQEIQKKKEKTNRELERERKLRTDSDDGMTKSIYSDADPLTKPRASSDQPVEGSEKGGRYARKSRNEHSSSEDRSNGRKGHKSRSLSAASHSQRYSDSPIRRHLSPTRRSLTPRRRKSPHARRRRSTSRLRHKSPSPYWRRSSHSRRSPFLPRRSPSPRHRRSRSPVVADPCTTPEGYLLHCIVGLLHYAEGLQYDEGNLPPCIEDLLQSNIDHLYLCEGDLHHLDVLLFVIGPRLDQGTNQLLLPREDHLNVNL
ncbi:hypothetical protein HPP92_012220 [Vanilla planifolia]|uniref:PWI domain-containing protein n=1 Tax=Vanilla planifolia TaxID=51239 RepID=A0A835V5S7_VANPL|nr:hypothetical protein HPP92_012220 [Vanilla planifolia]